MSRYRKIDMRMHGDEKYRRLSPCPPCGQALWWHMIAGKQTGVVPGLFSITEEGFAAQLGWPLKAFREVFREVFREGLAKANWDAHLVFVKNAIIYNPPTSPNVVKSWRNPWNELPECELKVIAWIRLKDFLKGFGKGFGEAFEKACRKPLANQEQEQEQEEIAAVAAVAQNGKKTKEPKLRPRDELFDAVAKVAAADPSVQGSQIGKVCKQLRAALPPYSAAEVLALPEAIRAAKLPDFTITVGSIPNHISRVRQSPVRNGSEPSESADARRERCARERAEYLQHLEAQKGVQS